MVEGLGVAGHHVESEYKEHRPHIDEVIVQANKLLENPDVYTVNQSPELQSLAHLNLDSNHMFLMLKRQLGKYYEERPGVKSSLHPEKSAKWREILYISLFKALTELTYASDKDQQLAGLSHIYKWYLDKTRIELPQIHKPKSSSTPRPKTTIVTQDNTMAARRERLLVRKMDAVKSIESRSPSPTRYPASPVVDRSEQTFTGKTEETFRDERYTSLFIETKQRERVEMKSSQVHYKLMNQWGAARSRLDERLLAKSELNNVRPRVMAVAGVHSEESEESNGEASSPKLLPVANSARSPLLVDLRHDRTKSATPSVLDDIPEDDQPFHPLSKIERARLVHKDVFQGHGEARGLSSDRLSLSFYSVAKSVQASARSATPGILNLSAVSYEETEREKKKRTVQITDIRRKLANRQVPCSYRTLSTGLAKPDDLPVSLLNHNFLPAGGEYFTPNPFSTLGKKKKGKKGKKKRR